MLCNISSLKELKKKLCLICYIVLIMPGCAHAHTQPNKVMSWSHFLWWPWCSEWLEFVRLEFAGHAFLLVSFTWKNKQEIMFPLKKKLFPHIQDMTYCLSICVSATLCQFWTWVRTTRQKRTNQQMNVYIDKPPAQI